MTNKSLVVYTALFGQYDDLLDPAPSDNCDYVCFTDNPLLKSEIWKIKVISLHFSEKMMNRLYKIKPHIYLSNYKASLYIDSNIKILKDPILLFKKYSELSDFLAIRHIERDCIYSEGLSCIANRGTDFNLTLKQMLSYASEGYPTKNSLFENRILIRNHNEKRVIELMEMWWDELNKWVHRDQLSLCYAAWKLKFKIHFISENPRFKNDYFRWYPHKNSEKRILSRVIRKIKFYIRWILIYPYYFYRIWLSRRVFLYSKTRK